jgi:tetratricopeptide (TPR) repeat protein
VLYQADIALKHKKFKDAQKLYQFSLGKHGDKAFAYQGLFISAYHLQKYREAESHAQKALETRPNLQMPHLIMSYIHAGQ